MSAPEFVSFDGLAGGGELGIILSGMKLIHRAGDLDLGYVIPETNRKVFGWDWDSHFKRSGEYARSETVSAPLLYSNCPCSAWSTLTRKDLRGSDAKVLKSTDALFDYAIAMKTPPEIVVLESVQQAFSTGRHYYQAKREELSEKTGHEYRLVWLMQSNASLGGSSVRRRAFIVYTRIPFGVEYAQTGRMTRFRDCVADLQDLNLTMAKQQYRNPATWWSASRRSSDGVDGHWNDPDTNQRYTDLMDRAQEIGEPWNPGEGSDVVLKRVYEKTGSVPEGWKLEGLLKSDFQLGLNQTSMWDPDGLGRVVTGQGYMHTVHWSENRLMTHREMFRLQGWPDTVRLWPSRDYKKLVACPGKGVPVDAGKWIGEWVTKAIEGEPGTQTGKEIGWQEYRYDITNAYKNTIKYERPWDYTQHTTFHQGHQRDDLVDIRHEEN